ncbi:hypothetical protein V7S43_002391 [Phytophthora oleae]|uniref:Uncharacterized protein n=1 Tax=Phytophthora oleae TaxID=2107226 RepID=A0ABD3G3E5_9STRA
MPLDLLLLLANKKFLEANSDCGFYFDFHCPSRGCQSNHFDYYEADWWKEDTSVINEDLGKSSDRRLLHWHIIGETKSEAEMNEFCRSLKRNARCVTHLVNCTTQHPYQQRSHAQRPRRDLVVQTPNTR